MELFSHLQKLAICLLLKVYLTKVLGQDCSAEILERLSKLENQGFEKLEKELRDFKALAAEREAKFQNIILRLEKEFHDFKVQTALKETILEDTLQKLGQEFSNFKAQTADHEVKFQNTILQLEHELEQQHKLAMKDNVLEKKEEIKEESNLKQLNSEVTDQVRKTSNAIHKETDNLGKTVSLDLQKRVVPVTEQVVAFHATLEGFSITNVTINQNIKFQNAILNLGDGYHPLQGVFIAPKSGIYLFSTTLFVQRHILYASLVKNGTPMTHMYVTEEAHEGVSATAVVQLEVGGEVWVRSDAAHDTEIRGARHSFFSGVLLHEI